MPRDRLLTVQQRVVLARNPQLWPASILEDGACLCLDREGKVGAGLAQAKSAIDGPYVLSMDGTLRGVYHHYLLQLDFTFVVPRQQPDPLLELSLLESKDVLTVTEALDYIALKYQAWRGRAALIHWAQRGLIEATPPATTGRRLWLLDRRSLDEEFRSGRLPLKRGPAKKG